MTNHDKGLCYKGKMLSLLFVVVDDIFLVVVVVPAYGHTVMGSKSNLRRYWQQVL
jgi:hypothetical protein